MDLFQINPAQIQVIDRLRALDPDYVELLAASMDANGLRTPIQVTVPDDEGKCRLIAGGHRLAAALQLGWPTIAAVPLAGNEVEREIAEIEENLIRRELTVMDHATFLARHKSLWEALHPNTQHGGDRRKKQVAKDGDLTQHPLSDRFSKMAAKKLGLAERSVQRAVTRYQALSPAIRDMIAGTWIADNGAALDDLVGRGRKLTETERRRVLELVLEPTSGIRRIPDALVKLRLVPAPTRAASGLGALQKAWNTQRDAHARAEYLDWLLREAQGAKPILAALARLQMDPVNRLTAADLIGTGLAAAGLTVADA